MEWQDSACLGKRAAGELGAQLQRMIIIRAVLGVD